MKRELKAFFGPVSIIKTASYRKAHPDEKGTERFLF